MDPGNLMHRNASLESFFSARRFALVLAVVVCACFAPVLFGLESFVYRDFGLFGHPLAHYSKESFWRGEVPLWNPLNNCGLPFMAQWNTMVFYPPSVVYLLFPLPWSLCVFCLLHLYGGGLGMFFLARRWTGSNFGAAFAGTVFSFNGLGLHCLMWPNNSAALAWMPWILLLVERACARGGWFLLPAILAGACQFMAGAPEAFLLTWVTASALLLSQVVSRQGSFGKLLARFASVVAGIVLLSAVQLLPLLELIGQSQRSAAYDTGAWAMPPWGWANLLVPLFRTTPDASGAVFQIGQAWTSSYYFGIGTVWLALLAIVRVRGARVRTLAVLMFLSLVLALGSNGFLWSWLKASVGALGFVRYPIKLIFLTAAPLTLLAAFGVAELMRTPVTEMRRVTRIAWGIAGFLLLAIAAICWFGGAHPMQGEHASAVLLSGITRAVILVVLTFLLWRICLAATRTGIVLACVWLGVILADLLTHTPWQNPTVNPSLLKPNLAELRDIRQEVTPAQGRLMPTLAALGLFRHSPLTNISERYAASRLGLSHNLNLLEGVAKCDGFFSLYINAQQDVQFRLFRDEETLRAQIADVTAIARVTAPGRMFDWSARSNYLPIVASGQQPVFLSAEQTLDTMLNDKFDPRSVVLLPVAAQGAVTATRQSEAAVTVENFRAHTIELKTKSPGVAIVTISQSFYAPWKAYVDEAPVPVWRANHAFQAVQVPAGEHRVRLRYEDRMFRIGALISGVVLVLMAAAAAIPGCRRAFVETASDVP